MADVTISSLPLGTPSGGIILPYSSGGNTYNATASAIVNSTFIEGNFTPTIIGSTSQGVGTYNTGLRYGKYTKIGNIVHFTLGIGWTAHTGSGAMLVTGLPYPNGGTNTILNTYIRDITTLFANWIPVSYVRLGEPTIGLEQILNASSNYSFISVSPTGNLYITGMYYLTY